MHGGRLYVRHELSHFVEGAPGLGRTDAVALYDRLLTHFPRCDGADEAWYRTALHFLPNDTFYTYACVFDEWSETALHQVSVFPSVTPGWRRLGLAAAALRWPRSRILA